MKEANKCLELIYKPVCKLSVQCAKCTVVNIYLVDMKVQFLSSISE